MITDFFFSCGKNFCGFCSQTKSPIKRHDNLRIQQPSPSHVFPPVCMCVFSLQMYNSQNKGKPHVIMWGVSTNILALNRRLAGNVVVKMFRVIIRWFYSLRSQATNSKAVSNLVVESYLLGRRKKKSKDLSFLWIFLWDLLNAPLVPCRKTLCVLFCFKRRQIPFGIDFPAYRSCSLDFNNHKTAKNK